MTEEKDKVILLQRVPVSLHHDLKVIAAQRSTSMQKIVTGLIVDEVEKEKELLAVR